VTSPIRIVLADDQELLRATFLLLLDAAPDLQVVAEAGNGVEAVATVRETVNRAMTKVHARDRAQPVVFACEHGLMNPGTRAL
jgi:DNA-binding NarL/FixJ family response regulator